MEGGPENVATAVDRFLTGQGLPAKGVTLLGRWFNMGDGGWALYEIDDPSALYETNAAWADLMERHTVPVIEDAQARPVLARLFAK